MASSVLEVFLFIDHTNKYKNYLWTQDRNDSGELVLRAGETG